MTFLLQLRHVRIDVHVFNGGRKFGFCEMVETNCEWDGVHGEKKGRQL